MALIVETGTRPAGANSYISAADASTYVSTYTDSQVWPDAVEEQEKALLIACQSLELNWGSKFSSFRKIGNDRLLWPRYAFYDADTRVIMDNTIPKELGIAQVELALMHLAGEDVFPNPSRQGQITQEHTKVDVIETHTWYANPSDYTPFRKVDLILRPLLRNKSATRMVR